MIKKTQKYLLINYPILWNIRIVPMIMVLLIIHLIFFGIGYLSTNVDFNKSYYYYFSPANTLSMPYAVSILVGILILIGWLVFYNRNNSFKTFYPCKIRHLYTEWLLIFAITSGIALIPYTLTQGYITRWKAAASLEETLEAINILNKARVLIPNDQSNYTYDGNMDKPIPIPHNVDFNAEDINLNLFSTQYSSKGGIFINGYVAPSLLFYKDYKYEYYYSYNQYHKKSEYITLDEIEKIKRQETVKEWLKEGQKDSIYTVMKEFDKLRKKHNLKFSITPDKWFQQIYNPPFFPVTAYNTIADYASNSYYDYDYEYNNYVEATVPYNESYVLPPVSEIQVDSFAYMNIYSRYQNQSSESITMRLPYYELENGYEQILKCYTDSYKTGYIVLFCMCLSLVVSIFIFSFRITAGKPWLIALITSGVLVFFVVLIGVGIRELLDINHDEIIVILMCLFWIVLFFALLIRILFKIDTEGNKGKSLVYSNILLWLLPCLIPISFLIYVVYVEYSYHTYNVVQDKHISCMFWINILFTIFAMWPLTAIIRRWKSLPEE